MSTPVYQQIGSLNLYGLEGGTPGPENYWAGYLPSPSASFGANVYPNQTWKDQVGVYLFLNETPGDFSTFLDELTQFLPKLSPQGDVRILWIENPNQGSAQWQWQFLKASATQSGEELNWVVARQVLFTLGAYTLAIDAGAAMTLSDDFDVAITFAIDSVTFQGPGGVYPAQGYAALMSLYGEKVGAFQAYLTPTDSNFSGLGVMLRYGALSGPSQRNPFGGVEMLDMPVLGLPEQTSLPMKLCFDPFNAHNSERNHLSFFPYDNSEPPALNGAFITTLGSGINLTPIFPAAPLRPARLVLNNTPTTDPALGGSSSAYHFAPDGAFHLEVVDPPAGQPVNLMLGLSGIEYLSLTSSKAICHFDAGQPAYMGTSPKPDNNYPSDISTLFTSEGTTAQVAILPEQSAQPGFVYYAQSNQASLFKTKKDTNFLSYHADMPVMTMPSYTTGENAVPKTYAAGCYANVKSSQFTLAQRLEGAAIAPFRRYQMGRIGTAPAFVHELSGAPPLQAYTKSGLLATLTSDGKNWQNVTIANLSPGPTTTISAASNGKALPQKTIDVESTAPFPTEGVVKIQIADGSSTLVGYNGKTPTAFIHCTGGSGTLNQNANVTTPTQITLPVGPKFQAVLQSNQVFLVASNTEVFKKDSPVSDQLNIDIAGWNFELGPANWRPGTNGTPTIMIFKYCSRSLGEMAGDTRKWSWPEVAEHNGSLAVTLNALQPFLQKPESGDPDDPLNVFYHEIVNNPEWNGFLFLNATVPLNALPPQLEGLAAGIDPSHFFAHHVGVNLSPLQSATNAGDPPTPSPSAFFGYINYTASADEASVLPGGDYAFQVDTLKVVFANSLIRSFHSKIQVTLNQMFGEQCTSANQNIGNNIFLNGTYQHHNGKSTYIFRSNGDTVYNINSPTLKSVDITGAQFVTIVPKGGLGSLVHCRFIFTGSLSFQTMRDVDLFSYSMLPFEGLWLDMAFNSDHPLASRSFMFDISAMAFRKQEAQLHEPNSGNGLASQFPLKLKGLVYHHGSGSTVGKGFIPANMPSKFSGVSGEYYALLYDLSLGTMGGLAPKKSFTAQIMLCWTPQPSYVVPQDPTTADYPAEMMMKLPFAGGGKDMLDIEGVIKLGIEGIELLAADNAYTIKLRDFGLHILSITLPPSGSTDIYLFGDPKSGSGALGWYAAYNKKVSYAQDPYKS